MGDTFSAVCYTFANFRRFYDNLRSMNHSTPNLFNALFEFHPRDGHSSKENFLSEAFAYVLTTCDGACDAWLSLAFRRRVQATQFDVNTQSSRMRRRNNHNLM